MPEVADYVLQRLSEWGVHRIYGYPGDGIIGFLGALDRAAGDPEFIQVRHEEMAAFMACGHAKFTGEVGVCMATSGPGAIHLLNGLYDAKLDHQPVVAIIGQQKRTSLGVHYQQEVDLQTLFKDVSAYVQYCMEPAQARQLVDRAMRIAADERVVCTLIFPGDVQEEKAVSSPPRTHGAVYSSVGYVRPRIVPPDPELDRAAELLNGAEKVAMLVGQGALGASEEVEQTAELLGAGVAKALLGRTVLPDDLPFVTGPIGLLGSTASYDMMESCDPRLVICVFNNQDLNQVTWEQRVLSGDPKYPGTQWLPDFPYARYAELAGFKGIYCEKGDEVGDAWAEALAADRPVLLEVRVDPEIPPLPPHIRVEQAKKMAEAMVKGAPAEAWQEMGARLRNAGRPGMGFMALAAVDTALWDLKARLLDLPLVDVLPRAHDAVPIYGSGGFCTYSLERLAEQLGGWAQEGIL